MATIIVSRINQEQAASVFLIMKKLRDKLWPVALFVARKKKDLMAQKYASVSSPPFRYAVPLNFWHRQKE